MQIFKDCYNNRFSPLERRRKDKIWKALCQYYFQQFIILSDVVMDIGAGYCEFLNHIKCRRKIAIDKNPDTKIYAEKNIEVVNLNTNILKRLYKGKVDKIFISNFFEHLNSKEEMLNYINIAYSILKPDGLIIIMQPNIKLVNGKYWDFVDHKLPLTISSLGEALEINHFQIVKMIEKFLPFTTKNSLPAFSWMIYLYLKTPTWMRINAGQSLIIAQKTKTGL